MAVESTERTHRCVLSHAGSACPLAGSPANPPGRGLPRPPPSGFVKHRPRPHDEKVSAGNAAQAVTVENGALLDKGWENTLCTD